MRVRTCRPVAGSAKPQAYRQARRRRPLRRSRPRCPQPRPDETYEAQACADCERQARAARIPAARLAAQSVPTHSRDSAARLLSHHRRECLPGIRVPSRAERSQRTGQDADTTGTGREASARFVPSRRSARAIRLPLRRCRRPRPRRQRRTLRRRRYRRERLASVATTRAPRPRSAVSSGTSSTSTVTALSTACTVSATSGCEGSRAQLRGLRRSRVSESVLLRARAPHAAAYEPSSAVLERSLASANASRSSTRYRIARAESLTYCGPSPR